MATLPGARCDSMAGMTAVAAPQAGAATQCSGTRVAHKSIKNGSTVIGYLNVYNDARMVCASADD
jgi:hypothetical protein